MAGKLTPQFGAKVDLAVLKKKITKLAHATSDLRPAWPLVDKYTTLVMNRQFNSEGAVLTGRRWRSWTAKWAKYRVRPGGGRGGIGRDSNTMWASFVKPRAPGSITRFDKMEYERGSVIPYAQHFQKRRPVWPETLPREIENVYLKLIVKHLEKAAS